MKKNFRFINCTGFPPLPCSPPTTSLTVLCACSSPLPALHIPAASRNLHRTRVIRGSQMGEDSASRTRNTADRVECQHSAPPRNQNGAAASSAWRRAFAADAPTPKRAKNLSRSPAISNEVKRTTENDRKSLPNFATLCFCICTSIYHTQLIIRHPMYAACRSSSMIRGILQKAGWCTRRQHEPICVWGRANAHSLFILGKSVPVDRIDNP